MKNQKETVEAAQGVATARRLTVDEVEKFVTGELNFLNFFLGCKPKVSVKQFRDVLPEKGKGVTDDQIKHDLVHFKATSAKLPLTLLTTPGLMRLIAEHVCGAQNNWLEAKARRGEIILEDSKD